MCSCQHKGSTRRADTIKVSQYVQVEIEIVEQFGCTIYAFSFFRHPLLLAQSFRGVEMRSVDYTVRKTFLEDTCLNGKVYLYPETLVNHQFLA